MSEEVTSCARCGEEILVDEAMLGDKIKGSDLYEELCLECFEKGTAA
jgi:hypothetical protein